MCVFSKSILFISNKVITSSGPLGGSIKQLGYYPGSHKASVLMPTVGLVVVFLLDEIQNSQVCFPLKAPRQITVPPLIPLCSHFLFFSFFHKPMVLLFGIC